MPRLSVGQIRSALKRGGRQRNLDTRAAEIQAALRTEQLAAAGGAHRRVRRHHHAPRWGSSPSSTVRSPSSRPTLADRFEQHPDADIYLSLPGLGVVLGARALGEFGDDPNRYANAKSRKNYAGTSPLTVASGQETSRARPPRPQPAALRRHRPMGVLRPLDQPRLSHRSTTSTAAAGDLHHQALRALGNRLVGILHGCLRHRTRYDEHTAWAHRQPAPDEQAA